MDCSGGLSLQRYQEPFGREAFSGSINKCGEIAKANGLRFAFHNHVDEFHELEGKIPFDVMIENTDKGLVTFQIDTAQLVYGGFKCHDYVNRYPGRFANWHLKDANADGKGSTEMAPES